MTTTTTSPNVPETCWGPKIPIEPSACCCSRLEFYQPAAIWRQASCQVIQEDPMRHLDAALTELVPDWQEQLQARGLIATREDAQQAASEVAPGRVSDLLSRLSCGDDPRELMAKLAQDMIEIGYLGAGAAKWAEAQALYSLLISFEDVPATILPPGNRGERSASIHGLVQRIGTQKVVVPQKVYEAWDQMGGRKYGLVRERITETVKELKTEKREKVAGRWIWDPWPFLVIHQEGDLEDLMSRVPGMVHLQEMTIREEGGQEVLVPRPWCQFRIQASRLIHRGTLPLEVLGGLPTTQRVTGRIRQAMNSPMQEAFKAIHEALGGPYLYRKGPRLWVLRP
jgi:hypothetical protein